jgi:hypothetical protein
MSRRILLSRFALTCALFTGTAAFAGIYDYPIDLTKELNGLKLTVNPSNGPLAKVTVVNTDTQPVACRAEFNTGLQTPVVRVAPIKPGKRALLTYSVPRDITRLKINLTCKPRASKDAAKEAPR